MTPAELKTFREALGLSTRWLSEYLKINEATLQRWENADPRYQPPQSLQAELDELNELFEQEVEAGIEAFGSDDALIVDGEIHSELGKVILVPVKDEFPVSPPAWPAETRRAIAFEIQTVTDCRIEYSP